MHLLHNPCREVGVNLPRQPLVSLPLTLLHHPPHTPLLQPLLGPLLPVEPLVGPLLPGEPLLGPLVPGEPLLGPLVPGEPLVQQMVPQSLTTLVELLRQPVTVVWGTMVGRGPLEPVNQLPLSQLLPLLPPLSPASLLPPRQIVMQVMSKLTAKNSHMGHLWLIYSQTSRACATQLSISPAPTPFSLTQSRTRTIGAISIVITVPLSTLDTMTLVLCHGRCLQVMIFVACVTASWMQSSIHVGMPPCAASVLPRPNAALSARFAMSCVFACFKYLVYFTLFHTLMRYI